MRSKRGENEAKAVATIIMVIAFAIALYVLLIPPEDRQALIDGDSLETTSSEIAEEIELLAESPGDLSPRQEKGTVHSINNMNLFIKNEPELIPLTDALEIKKKVYSQKAPRCSASTHTTLKT